MKKDEPSDDLTGIQGNEYHVPVLFKETIDVLHIKPDGIYVDCTFGGGGHSRGILQKLDEKGKLFAFDQDADAKANLPADERVIFIQQNFRHIARFLRLHQFTQVDGILADLGVSSHQFNEAERGFSTRFAGPLDMRMNRQQEFTAANILNNHAEMQLHKMFEQYGEVTNAKTLAKFITEKRRTVPFKTANEFIALLQPVIKGNPHKYLAQVFQALRIEVNDEMGALKELLEQITGLLRPGGICAIITFHSLEDRLVKNFFRHGSFEEQQENPFSTEQKKILLKTITKKPVAPSAEEIKNNPRSRSAKLRAAEKV